MAMEIPFEAYDATKRQEVPFGFAQGRLSTTHLFALRLIKCSAQDDTQAGQVLGLRGVTSIRMRTL